MNVQEIVASYLREHGYDGLFNEEAECACELGDLNACGELGAGCEAGYRVPCTCGDHDWHIVSSKLDKDEEES